MSAKRSRGAQPNNKNARKHGFYEGAFTNAARAVLKLAGDVDADSLVDEITLLRARIFELQRADPSNITVLTLALHSLVRMIALNYSMSPEQQEDLTHSLRDLIHDLTPERSAA